METKQGSVSAPRKRERSVMLVPAIVTTVLVVTLVPAAVLFLTRVRRRTERRERPEPASEEPRPTWYEACVDAMRELPGTA